MGKTEHNMSDDFAVGAFMVFLIFLVVGLFVLGPGLHISSVGEGRRTGFITAVQPEGYFFPNSHVYFKTDNSSSQEDSYCINRSNTDLIAKAKEYNQARKLVTVTFHGIRGFGYDLCHYQEISAIEVDR